MPDNINDTDHTEIDEAPQELTITLHTTAHADELFRRWQELCDMVAQASEETTEIGQRWKDATDRTVKDQAWTAYESQAREYRVLASWRDLFYVAYVFTTDGADCTALDSSPAN